VFRHHKYVTKLSSNTAFIRSSAAAAIPAANSIYRNAGTMGIDPGFLLILRQNHLSAGGLSNTAFAAAPIRPAQRDADMPDLGYHYDRWITL